MAFIGHEQPNGTIHVEATCDHCGKPIVTTGRYGMDCEDGCVRKRAETLRKEHPELGRLLDFICPKGAGD